MTNSATPQKDILPLQFNGDLAIRESNELVRARQDHLTELEAKLIYTMIANIPSRATEPVAYVANIKDLATAFRMHTTAVYKKMAEATDSIMKKTITFSQPGRGGKDNYRTIHWVQEISYINGVYRIKPSAQLMPFVSNLKKLFSIKYLENVNQLKSGYSIRLFSIVISWIMYVIKREPIPNSTEEYTDPDEIIYHIDELRDMMDCNNKYEDNKDFIRWIIKPSVQDIQEHSTHPFTFRTIKHQKKLEYVVFKLENKETTEISDEPETTVDPMQPM